MWCNALEATLIEFVNGDSLKAALHLPVMKRPQRTFVSLSFLSGLTLTTCPGARASRAFRASRRVSR